MPNEVLYSAAGLVSYFVGAIPFGFLIAKLKGVDIRTVGSGNIGATNVGRVCGWPSFVLVLILDFAKGLLPVLLLAPFISENYPCKICLALPASLKVLCGLCAFLGHMFPIYLGFKGGKGVATGLGAAVAMNWLAASIAVGVFLLVLLITGFVSVGSIVAAVAISIAHPLIDPSPWNDQLPITLFFFLAVVLVIIKHRSNIRRVARGEEPKVFRRNSPKEEAVDS